MVRVRVRLAREMCLAGGRLRKMVIRNGGGQLHSDSALKLDSGTIPLRRIMTSAKVKRVRARVREK